MSPKKPLEKQQKTGKDILLYWISLVLYLNILLADVQILYLALIKGSYYDFAYEWYPVSIVRLPLCILGIILLIVSKQKGKPRRANKWILLALVLLFIIRCFI